MGLQLLHERAVDLKAIEREFLQVAQARITGAEVIEEDANAEGAKTTKDLDRVGVLDEDILGHLELEQVRRATCLGEHRPEDRNDFIGLKLRGREVDGDRNSMSLLLPPAGLQT